MNLQLDNVISDITGVTGMQILRALIEDERNPQVLAEYRVWFRPLRPILLWCF